MKVSASAKDAAQRYKYPNKSTEMVQAHYGVANVDEKEVQATWLNAKDLVRVKLSRLSSMAGEMFDEAYQKDNLRTNEDITAWLVTYKLTRQLSSTASIVDKINQATLVALGHKPKI